MNCDGCDLEIHFMCKCEDKIPVKELIFVKSQRDKVGTRSS